MLFWGSISGAGEWWHKNAHPEKTEQPGNLTGTLLEPWTLDLCWNAGILAWTFEGTFSGTRMQVSKVLGLSQD